MWWRWGAAAVVVTAGVVGALGWWRLQGGASRAEVTSDATFGGSRPLAASLTGGSTPSANPRWPTGAPQQGASDPEVLLAAGDIASCTSKGDEATAQLLKENPGTIATLGDNAYPAGTAGEFQSCYDPSCGRFIERTHPAPGNHEYATPGAGGYFQYFGAAAGEPGAGYYSYEIGTWHIIVLNSNCGLVGGCGPGSRQERWLRQDLAAHPAACTLAYWHHPRFSSGPHGGTREVGPLWQALYENGVDVVLNGHDHIYERFAPQDPSGRADPDHGIRQFTVGTGGAEHYRAGPPVANSEVRNSDTFGVLKLTLDVGSYTWQFLPEPGKSFTDSGHGTCH
jgi:hypothetical protein